MSCLFDVDDKALRQAIGCLYRNDIFDRISHLTMSLAATDLSLLLDEHLRYIELLLRQLIRTRTGQSESEIAVLYPKTVLSLATLRPRSAEVLAAQCDCDPER